MKAFKVLTVAALAALMCACGGKELTLNRSTLTLNAGDKSDLTLVGETEYATWESADDFIAKVAADASITTTVEAKHVGETVITAKTGKKEGHVVVTVEPKSTAISKPIDFSLVGKTVDEIKTMWGEQAPDTITDTFIRYILKNYTEQYVYRYENNVITGVTVYFGISTISELNNVNAALAEYLEYYEETSNPTSYYYEYGNAYKKADAKNLLIFGNTGQQMGSYLIFAAIYPYIEDEANAPMYIKSIE